eukprot:4251263-Alexandrium_andersonii.AAC.1
MSGKEFFVPVLPGVGFSGHLHERREDAHQIALMHFICQNHFVISVVLRTGVPPKVMHLRNAALQELMILASPLQHHGDVEYETKARD